MPSECHLPRVVWQVFVSTEPVSTIASKSDSFSKDIVQFSIDVSLVDLLGFSFHGSFGSTFNQFPFGPADFCLDYVYRFTAYWNILYMEGFEVLDLFPFALIMKMNLA